MASSDYRCCDRCGRKTFYDSELNYEFERDRFSLTPEKAPRENGVDTGPGLWLEQLGDWAVICSECAKTHRTIVVPIGEQS